MREPVKETSQEGSAEKEQDIITESAHTEATTLQVTQPADVPRCIRKEERDTTPSSVDEISTHIGHETAGAVLQESQKNPS